jgi:hypothetical protein
MVWNSNTAKCSSPGTDVVRLKAFISLVVRASPRRCLQAAAAVVTQRIRRNILENGDGDMMRMGSRAVRDYVTAHV